MLRVPTLPGSLSRVLEPFRPCFTAPTFTTFVTLVAGMVAQPVSRTVCGMLAGAGMAGVWHHSRAHRFFTSTRWHPDAVGLTVLRLIVGNLLPIGAPLTVAVDDTLFRRCGRRVYAAHWGYDGSLKVAKGNQKLSRGNIAAATRGRSVHVVGDGAYLCTELRRLPPNATLTGPLRSNASLWHVHPDLDSPPRLRGRGRPRVYGTRIGTPADLAAATPAISVTATRYRRTTTVQVHHQRCLWRGVFGARPVRVLVLVEPGKPSLALVTTDLTTPVTIIVERYAARWAIEVAFEEAKQVTGVGEARNRIREAVERTVPFGLYTQSIVIVWYHLAGHHPNVVDMIVKLRRVLIAAQYQPEVPTQPTHEEIRAVRLAWAQAAASRRNSNRVARRESSRHTY